MKTVWITYFYDVGPIVQGVYASEIEALRACNGGSFYHAVEVPLPCADFHQWLRDKSEVVAR